MRRRRFLQGLGTLALAPWLGGLAAPPRVVVVGAGLAGLTAAWTLAKRGLRSTVYEASDRVGGRVFSGKDLLAPGLVTELGGEFIDSTHTDMLALIRDFGLPTLDMTKQPPGRKILFIGGRRTPEDELDAAFAAVAKRIAADYASPSRDRFDEVSLRDYVTGLGVGEPLRTALLTDYTVENGLDPEEQSSLNLILAVGPSPEAGFTGNTDHRYKVLGGNQRICQKMAEKVEVRLDHRLAAVRPVGEGYRVHFAHGASADADFLILALPFTLLRQVDLPPLPEGTSRAIRELSYGTNSKLCLGFSSRFWDRSECSGSFLCDQDLQDGWDSSRLQGGAAGSLTLYFGGRQGLANGEGTAESRARSVLGRLDEVLPGAAAGFTGKATRMHWPSYPWSLGSYSGYRVGEYTRLCGVAQSLPRLVFAGEHMSRDWQGFMNGAAETGRLAAESIVASVGRG